MLPQLLTHELVGDKTPIPKSKKSVMEKVASAFDPDPLRTLVQPDIESMFDFKEDTLLWAYFAYNTYTDKIDLRARGKLKSEYDGSSDKKSVRNKTSYFPNIKASEHPKLIKGARAFLKTKGYNTEKIKSLTGIRFLIEYEEKAGDKGRITAQIFYNNAENVPSVTPFIYGEF